MTELERRIGTAAKAHTNLTMFYAIIALAESGGFYGHHSETGQIIKTAKRGAARCLREYDRAVAQVAQPAQKDPSR